MAGLSVWNGSAFVEGEPRIWNGSAFVAPSSCHVWDGSQFVKVWPSFTRQRINKSGTQSMPGSGTVQITGWTPDGTYPGVVSSNALQVVGAGAASVTAVIGFTASPIASNPTTLRINGTVVATNNTFASSRTLNWSGTLAAGDLLTLWHAASFGNITTSTYIDVNPT